MHEYYGKFYGQNSRFDTRSGSFFSNKTFFLTEKFPVHVKKREFFYCFLWIYEARGYPFLNRLLSSDAPLHFLDRQNRPAPQDSDGTHPHPRRTSFPQGSPDRFPPAAREPLPHAICIPRAGFPPLSENPDRCRMPSGPALRMERSSPSYRTETYHRSHFPNRSPAVRPDIHGISQNIRPATNFIANSCKTHVRGKIFSAALLI